MKNFLKQNYNEIILAGLVLVAISPVVSLVSKGIAHATLVVGSVLITAGVVALANDKE